jgi:hypothetical protein
MIQYNILAATRFGMMLYNRFDAYVGQSIEKYGEFSYGEVKIFDHFISEGQVVIDCGANIGAHTLFFARKVGLTGKVYAFEPQRIVFQTLAANMALNSVSNVFCKQCATKIRKQWHYCHKSTYRIGKRVGKFSSWDYGYGRAFTLCSTV